MVNRLHGLILLFPFVILSVAVFSQQKEQDTLITAADSLFEAGEYHQAIGKYKDYLNSHGKVKDDEKEIMSDYYKNIALCYYNLDKYSEAIDWFKKALDLHMEIGDLENVATTLNNIGINYKMQGNYDKAIEYYEQTIIIDEQLGNENQIAKTLNNIGLVYRAWGKYDKAIEYFERSLHLRNRLNDQQGAAKTLNNIGLVYSDWKKYDQAILSFRESLKIEESVQNISGNAISLNNLGRVYFYMKMYDTALAYFDKALQIHLNNQDQDQIALAYNNIGKVYNVKGYLKEALSFYTSALEIYNILGKEGEKATVLANLSDINRAMGSTAKALQLLDSSTMIADKLKLMSQLQQNYLYFSEIYSGQKDFEKSLEYYKKYNAVKDSVFTKEILSQLSDFQTKYEKEKDQARILALEKENLKKTNQRNAYMFTGLGIIVFAIFMVIYFRQRAAQVKLLADQKIRRLEEEQKMMAAKLLVEGQEEERKRIATELHDGLGVLLSATKMQFSVIKDKSPENKELIEKATRMLEQATGDVRKISHNMMPGLLTKLGFYEAVEDLFETVDDTSDLNAVCTITGSQDRLAANKEIMLYRIVQEMVNNSLKYAQAANIELQITVNPGMLDLIFYDDGKGFEIREKLDTESFGLKSIQSRVNFLNGKMDLFTRPGEGVKYTLQIPI